MNQMTQTPQNPQAATVAQGAPARSDERPALLPPVDVIEDAEGITLLADLPGVAKDQLHLRVERDQLDIEAELQLPAVEGLQPLHAEVTRQFYRRTFTLSKELDAEQVTAEMNQGVLRVRIPKAGHLHPRKIEVRAA